MGSRETSTFWHGLKSSFDGYGNHWNVEFLAQDGKGLFKLTQLTIGGAGALGEDDKVLLVAQGLTQLLYGVLDVAHIHHNDVVSGGQKLNEGLLTCCSLA